MEKFRSTLDRECTTTSGYLHDHKDNGNRFTNITKGDSQCIDQIDINKTCKPARYQEQERMFALNTKEIQVSQTDGRFLNTPVL